MSPPNEPPMNARPPQGPDEKAPPAAPQANAPHANAPHANAPNAAAPWYLAQLRPNAAHIAQAHLTRQGFGVFCPTQSETRRRGARFVEVETLLFPGYLFVTFDPTSAPWRAINSTRGISRLVTFGTAPPGPLPDPLIRGLMARCDAAGHLLPPTRLEPGDRVQVAGGPFADFVARVEAMAAPSRVWVLLDILGRDTRVAIDLDRLHKV